MKQNNANSQSHIHDALLRAQPQPDAESQRRLEERVIEALRSERSARLEQHLTMEDDQMNLIPGMQYAARRTGHMMRRTRYSILTSAAAMTILVLVGGLMMIRLLPTSIRSATPGAQPTPPPLDSLVPITAENAAQLAPLYTLGTGSLMDADWSPDGQTIVLATTQGLYVQDANDLNAPGVRLLGVDGARLSGGVIYSADGTRIAAITGETLPDAADMRDPESENRIATPYAYALTVWDAATGEVLAQIDAVSWRVVGFVENNTQVVTETCAEGMDGLCTDDYYALKFWDITSGQEIVEKRYVFEEMPYQYQPMPYVTISADGQLLVYNAGSSNFNRIRIVNLRAPEHHFALNLRGTLPFTLSPDGRWLMVYDNDKWLMYAYDVAAYLADPGVTEPYSVHEFYPIPGIVSSSFDWLRFSADGSRLVMHSDRGQAVIADPAPLFAQPGEFLDDASAFRQFPPQAVHELPGRHYYQQHLSPDGTKMLFQAIAGGTLMMYDLKTGEKLQQSDFYHPYYYDIQFSDEMLVGSQIYWPDGKARLFDLSGQTPTETIFPGDVSGENAKAPYNAMQIRLSEGGRYALYQNDDNLDSVYSLMWLDRHTGRNYKLQPLMRTVTTGFTEDGSALILDSNSFVRRYDFTSLVSADGPAVTRLGERIADSSTILQGTPASGFTFLMRAAFSPDGRIIVLSASNELRVYSTTTGALLARLDGLDFPEGREGISFSGGGRYVTANGCVALNSSEVAPGMNMLTCDQPHARVWDLAEVYALLDAEPDINPDSAEPLTIAPVVNLPVDTSARIQGLASLPLMTDDGELTGFLVAAGDFTQIRVWFVKSVNSGDAQNAESELLATLPGETISLAFSPDETLLAVGGSGTVTLWGVPNPHP